MSLKEDTGQSLNLRDAARFISHEAPLEPCSRDGLLASSSY